MPLHVPFPSLDACPCLCMYCSPSLDACPCVFLHVLFPLPGCLSLSLLSPPALLSELWPSLLLRESSCLEVLGGLSPVAGHVGHPVCVRPRAGPLYAVLRVPSAARGSLAWSPGWRVGGQVQPGQVTTYVTGVGLCQEQATWSLSRGAALWRHHVRSCLFSRALGGATRPGLWTPSVNSPLPLPGPTVQLPCGQGTLGEDARPRRARSPAEGSLGGVGLQGTQALHLHHDGGGQDTRDPWSRLVSLLPGRLVGSRRAAPGHRVTGTRQSQQAGGLAEKPCVPGAPEVPTLRSSGPQRGSAPSPVGPRGAVSFM